MTVGEEDGLRLTDADQVEALQVAVYRSARVTGLGPDRAARLAQHVAAHLAGQLRQHGYAVRWASPEARQALESSRLVVDQAAGC